MNPWLETAGVILLAALGCCIGRWFSRLPKWYWTLGYILPLGLVLIMGLARHWNAFAFTPPVSWLMTGRIPYALAALMVTMVLTTPLRRLPNKRDRRAVTVFMLLVVWTSAVSIFLAPALNRKYLESLQTRIDDDGICRQSNDYNCGPAAAVTALRKLGLPAEEGELAILAHTSFSFGTPPDILASTLRKRYSQEGLVSEYKYFKSIDDLRHDGFTLAVIKFGFLVDHYVTVLEVGDEDILVGDPFLGKTLLSHREFVGKWRYRGVVLRKER